LVGRRGISIGPGLRVTAGLLTLLGLADLRFEWEEIAGIDQRRSPLLYRPGSERTLIWWSLRERETLEVLDLLATVVPDKVVR
jgi:hypothetical protein